MLAGPKFKKMFSVFGLALLFLLNSCATAPTLTHAKRTKQWLETQTKPVASPVLDVSPQQVRKKLEQFKKVLKKGKLTQSDWKLHDELLDYYSRLKQTASTQLTIPPKTRVTLPLETYCLNAGRASPSRKEVYHWQKSKPDIKYYFELLDLRRKGEIKQQDIQELLWNLGNETRWDDYPDRLKAILQKIDPKAFIHLPSRLKDQAKNIISDTLIGLPGASEALDAYNFIKGKYYTYEDFKKSVESLTSNHELSDYDDLPQIPRTELYSQSASDGYRGQKVTFYNPTDRSQEVDLTEYYLTPERKDVQRIGINPLVPDPTLISDLEKVLYESMARLGIGFTPVLGDVADLYELIYGKDFLTGKHLSFDERLASGVGVALGSGSAYRHAKRWINAPSEYLPKFEGELAKAASKNSGRPNYENTGNILEKSHFNSTELKRGLDYRGTQELSQFLKDARIPRLARTRTIKSFEPTSIRRRVISNDETVYRWHSGDKEVKQMGRFVTPDRIEDSRVGRGALALPNDNQMKHLDTFTLKKGSVVFEGKIAPNFGHDGGGKQILIMSDLEKSLQFNERIK